MSILQTAYKESGKMKKLILAMILMGIVFAAVGCCNCPKGGKYLVCVDNDGNGVGCYCTNEYIINTNNSTITLFSIEDNVSITLAYDGFSVYSQ